jgi:hypothetical protein
MIFLLPPKYRFYYWGCVLTGGAIIIGFVSLGLLINGSIGGGLVLGLFDVMLIIVIRHIYRRIMQIRAEANQKPPTESTFLNE